MARLIIVGGASGTGKSFFLENAQKIQSIIPIIKISTREPRGYEASPSCNFYDVVGGHTYDDVKKCDYTYPYSENYYGFNRKDVRTVLENGQNPIVIVKHFDMIKQLQTEYPEALSIYITSVLSGEDLAETLKNQGRSDIEINKRMERIYNDILDYSENILENMFDYFLINRYDQSLLVQMNTVFNKELFLEEER